MRWIQDLNNFLKKSILFIIILCVIFHSSRIESFTPGGKVNIYINDEPDYLNPLFSQKSTTKEILNLIFDGLINIDENGNLSPNLLISVPTLENKQIKIYTKNKKNKMIVIYKLRSHIYWHDNYPLTSEDIEFTWKSFIDPSISVVNRDGYDKIEKIELVDKLTAKVYFSTIYPDFYLLFNHILPKHILKNKFYPLNQKHPFNRSPIGTGPFYFQEWKQSSNITLNVNNNYHKGRANLDQINYKFSNFSKQSLTKIVNDSDIIKNIPILLFPYIKDNPKLSFSFNPLFLVEHLDFNMKKPLLEDIRIRRAIAHAINKKQMVEEIFLDIMIPTDTDQYIPYNNSKIKFRYPYDIEKSKKLLEQTGLINSKPISFDLLIVKDNYSHKLVAEFFKYSLEKIGISLNIRPLQEKDFFTSLFVGNFDLALYTYKIGPKSDNYNRFFSKQIPPNGTNYTRFIDPDVDKLIIKANNTLDNKKRKFLYKKISDYLIEFIPTFPLYYHVNINSYNKNIYNFRPNAFQGDTWNSYEWWYR